MANGLIVALTTVGGALVGFVVTLAIIVAKAQFGQFIFALDDILAVRWELLPVPIGAMAGFRLARRRPGHMAWATVCGFGAMLLGILVGVLVASSVLAEGAGAWAGGVIGGALGLVAGIVSSLRIRHVPRNALVAGGAGTIVLLGVMGFAIFGATNFLNVDPLDLPAHAGVPLPDPASVDAVVFLVGDAGAAETATSPLLAALRADVERWSTSLRRDSATSVIYLGDNVYPVGVRGRDDPGFATDSARLWGQIDVVGGEAARREATTGVFITGNHDWGNAAGDAGIDRVRNLDEQIVLGRRAGRFVSLQPTAGDPGPVVRDLRRNVRLLFVDTHWFLQERDRGRQARFFADLAAALAGARDREVVIVAHHPYYSAGPHGAVVPGYHTGGLAYILKQSGALVQDLNSPAYAELLGGLRKTFEEAKKPPLIYAGGHDHSLQVLTGAGDFDPRFVLVSGAGSKVSSIAMGPGLVWGGEQPGYMMLVFRKDDGVDLFVVGGNAQQLRCAGTDAEVKQCLTTGRNAFRIVYSASLLGASKQPRELIPVEPESLLVPDSLRQVDTVRQGSPWWTDNVVPTAIAAQEDSAELRAAPVAVSMRVLMHGVDSVNATPGRSYPAGRLRRLFAGDLNRHLWRVTVRLPVIDLDSVGGGLHPEELIGGKQTVGLRLNGRDGLEYEFRPIVKNAERVLPSWLRKGPIVNELSDQMAAQFPFSATVVAELLDAVGIPVPKPMPSVMPNDQRLGEYRSIFAGRVGMIAMNPNERKGGKAGFAGYTRVVDGDEIFGRTRQDTLAEFDAQAYLRVRLIDMLVGDWDRHVKQWRWGRLLRDRGPWEPIPEDRDWAFSRMDGFVGALARVMLPRYVGFSESFPAVKRLAWAAEPLDRRVLNTLDRADFVAAAREIHAVLTDSALAAAVGVLPLPYRKLERDRLLPALRARRDALVEYGDDYYEHVARTVHVFGFDRSRDVVEFVRATDNRVRVRVRSGGPTGTIRFDRIIDARDTREVRLFISPGEDRVTGADDLPFRVRIADPKGADDRAVEVRRLD